jgi:hypothetical protein
MSTVTHKSRPKLLHFLRNAFQGSHQHCNLSLGGNRIGGLAAMNDSVFVILGCAGDIPPRIRQRPFATRLRPNVIGAVPR